MLHFLFLLFFTCSHQKLIQETKEQVVCAAHPSLELPVAADTVSSLASHSSVLCLLQVVEMMVYQSYLIKIKKNLAIRELLKRTTQLH